MANEKDRITVVVSKPGGTFVRGEHQPEGTEIELATKRGHPEEQILQDLLSGGTIVEKGTPGHLEWQREQERLKKKAAKEEAAAKTK